MVEFVEGCVNFFCFFEPLQKKANDQGVSPPKKMSLTHDLYEIANTKDRDLLPLERVRVPGQRKRRSSPSSLLRVVDNQYDEDDHRQPQSSSTSRHHTDEDKDAAATSPGGTLISRLNSMQSSEEDADWLRSLGNGNYLPRSVVSAERRREKKREEEEERKERRGQEEEEEKGERLLAAINRMEKYLTRDIMLQELASIDNVQSVTTKKTMKTSSTETAAIYDTSTDSGEVASGSAYNSTAERTWLEREKERLYLIAATSGEESMLSMDVEGYGTSALLSLPTNGSSTMTTMTTMTEAEQKFYADDITTSLGLPLFPQEHRSKKQKPTLIGESEVSVKNLPTLLSSSKKKSGSGSGSGSGALPSSFAMPEGMVHAVSNVPPFRGKLQKHSLKRGDWVAEGEVLMTEERREAIKAASSNVQPPFWNPNGTTTVVQYGRDGHQEEKTVVRYDYECVCCFVIVCCLLSLLLQYLTSITFEILFLVLSPSPLLLHQVRGRTCGSRHSGDSSWAHVTFGYLQTLGCTRSLDGCKNSTSLSHVHGKKRVSNVSSCQWYSRKVS